jgi:hypothetical protein
MRKYRKLAINVGLAFLASFASTFGAFMAATPENPGTSALIATAAAAAWAGFRAAVGFIAMNTPAPTIPVDK